MRLWDLESEEEWVKVKAKASAGASNRARAGSSKTEYEGEEVQNSNHDAREVQIKRSIPETFQSTKITRSAR